MAITTYAELKTATARWLGGGDDETATTLGLTDSIDDLVTVGESRLLREVMSKDNEESLTSTITASGVISVPSDYVRAKLFYLNTTPTQFLEPRPLPWIYSQYPLRSSEGQPAYFAREAGNFIFGPFPDSTYVMKGVYYKKLAALSTAVNNLFTNNPDLYLFASLAESAILIGQDSRIKLWEQKYQNILAQVNGLTASEFAGGSLRMRLT